MKVKQPKLNILITAGPTREYLDPVRFISNQSTGTIGYNIARVAKKRGNNIVLLSGPVNLKAPYGVKTLYFTSALDLKKLLNKYFKWADCIICTAAVGDFRPLKRNTKKIKKNNSVCELKLAKNPDILKEIGSKKGKKILVGFALETENLVKNSLLKLKQKNLDFIVANLCDKRSVPFGNREVTASIISKKGIKKYSKISKIKLSRIILDRVNELCYILMQPKKRR